MHGQSDYTPTKQRHLSGILSTCREAWQPGKHHWAHPELILIDCTAGSGRSADGEKGSPLILQQHAIYHANDAYRLLCCEIDRNRARQLEQAMGLHERLTVIHGDYQYHVPLWLEEQNITRPALGLIYVDANGARDMVQGYEMLQVLQKDKRFNRIDLLFHWSLTAYNRNAGADNSWATDPLVQMCEKFRQLKRYWFAREPLEKWRWVFMHGMNTNKVKVEWRKERMVKFGEWLDNIRKPEQIAIFS